MYSALMPKIRFVRPVLTATVGQVSPGDIHDVVPADAERYIRNGWAEPVAEAKPRKRAAR